MAEEHYDKEHNLGWHIREWFRPNMDKVLIVQANERNELGCTTYRELYADVLAWADFFTKHGVRRGDRVAMISQKCPDHFRFFYACWHLGAIAVPICETFGKPEMTFVLQDCEPSIILVDTFSRKAVRETGTAVTQVLLDDMPRAERLQGAPANVPLSDAAQEDVACLIYTSGSTGMPKGVMLTHRNILANVTAVDIAFDIAGNDRIMSLLPYWHSYALECEIMLVPVKGMQCAVARDMKDFKKNLAKYSPTQMIVVPRVIETFKQLMDKQIERLPEKRRRLVEKAIYNASRIFTARPRLDGGILRILTHHIFYDPLVFRKFRQVFGGRLKFIVCGGAPLDLELQIFFKFLGIPLLQGYGLTESAPIVSTNLMHDHLLGSIGRVLKWATPEWGGDYTFKDEQGNLGKDKHGQLLVRGDCVMKGYWRHTDASAKTMENGWLNTGDVGYATEDGYLFIDGRKGNMIVLIGGEKLHPESVEDAVKSSQLITEAMVIGEKCKNVYVLANVPREELEKHTPEELRKLLKEDIVRRTSHLAPFQKPKDVLILPDFNIEDGTLTATLKVRRRNIAEKYAAQIEDFLRANGEDDAIKHDVSIASSKVMESLAAARNEDI